MILSMLTLAWAAPAPDWLAGCWSSRPDSAAPGLVMTECWTDAGGGLMLGVGRSVEPGEEVFFEQLRIVSAGDTWTYVAAPHGAEETRFVLQEQGETWVLFSNPAHDFPQQIRYERAGRKLEVNIRGVDASGAEQQMGWTLWRVRAWPR